jgi:hypothetical protein
MQRLPSTRIVLWSRPMKAIIGSVVYFSLAVQTSAGPLYDLVFLLDGSGSLTSADFTKEKNFITAAAQGMMFGTNDTAAGLISFATTTRVEMNMTISKATFVNVSANVGQLGGNSNFTAALIAAQNQFAQIQVSMPERVTAKRVIAIVGDGPANIDAASVTPKLDELAANGVHIYSIYFTGSGDPAFMQSLVRNGGQSYPISTPNLAATFANQVYWLSNTIPGDYNYNGTVDAADYVWWRLKLGTSGPMVNDATPGVTTADYDVWRAGFGNALGNGTTSASVPEASPYLPLLLATIGLLSRRQRNATHRIHV